VGGGGGAARPAARDLDAEGPGVLGALGGDLVQRPHQRGAGGGRAAAAGLFGVGDGLVLHGLQRIDLRLRRGHTPKR
jgi:hypothetical protein